MEPGQLILYFIIALLAINITRRFILLKTIKQYSPVELLQQLKKTRNVLLLDVRTKEEHKSGSIKNSLHIPLAEIKNRSEELLKYKEKEIVCYCRTGNRSLSAAAKLKKNGFNVANLKGGILQWNAVGLK